MAYEAIQSSYGIIRWPFLATPRPSDTGGTPKFAVTFVAGGPNGLRAGDQEFLAAIQKQMDEACIAKWNIGIEGMRTRCAQNNKVFNLALKRNSDPTRAKHAGIGDAPQGFHFEAKTQFPVDLFDPQGNKLMAADPMMFYDGAVCRVWVSSYSYEHPKSGPGIGLNLNAVQFVQHGPRLGGAVVDAKPVDQSAVPSDLPRAPAPNVQPQQSGTNYGQGDNNPPAANPGANYGGGQQQPPAGQPGGFGF